MNNFFRIFACNLLSTIFQGKCYLPSRNTCAKFYLYCFCQGLPSVLEFHLHLNSAFGKILLCHYLTFSNFPTFLFFFPLCSQLRYRYLNTWLCISGFYSKYCFAKILCFQALSQHHFTTRWLTNAYYTWYGIGCFLCLVWIHSSNRTCPLIHPLLSRFYYTCIVFRWLLLSSPFPLITISILLLITIT